MVVNFRRDQISMDFVSFLSMKFYMHHQHGVRHNICSTWFLDIRISSNWNVLPMYLTVIIYFSQNQLTSSNVVLHNFVVISPLGISLLSTQYH